MKFLGPALTGRITFGFLSALILPGLLVAGCVSLTKPESVTRNCPTGSAPSCSDDPNQHLPPDDAKKDTVAKPDTVRYDSDSLDYDAETKRILLYGHAHLQYRTTKLSADTIDFDQSTEILDAQGSPTVEDPQIPPFFGTRLKYNLKTRYGAVFQARSFKNGEYYRGAEIRRLPDKTMQIVDGDFCKCNGVGVPDYYIAAERLEIEPDKQATGAPVVLKLEDVPVAVVVFHHDYTPPMGPYYFRETAFSAYNGARLVQDASRRFDRDVAAFADALAYWLGYKVFRIPLNVLFGIVAGTHTQPVVLGYATQQSKNDLPNVGFASVYPLATILKIVLAQLLLGI